MGQAESHWKRAHCTVWDIFSGVKGRRTHGMEGKGRIKICEKLQVTMIEENHLYFYFYFYFLTAEENILLFKGAFVCECVCVQVWNTLGMWGFRVGSHQHELLVNCHTTEY